MQHTVVLVRGTEYVRDDITFQYGIPVTIEEELAKRLIRTRRFRSYTGEEITPQSREVLPGILRINHAPRMPKSELGLDNLNDKRVLLRRSGALGDCVFIAQFAMWLRERYPRAELVAAVSPKRIPLMRVFSCFDDVISVHDAAQHDTVVTFDYLVDFNGVIEQPPMRTRQEDYYELHLARAGISPAELETLPLCTLNTASAESIDRIAAAIEFIKKNDFNDGYVIVLRGTSSKMKTWNERIMQNVVQELAKQHNVIVLGTKDDKAKRKIAIPRVVQATDLPVEVACELINRASAFIGGDTGLTHFANAIGTPTVSYWCATNSLYLLKHLETSERSVAVCSKSACHPCHNLHPASCKHHNDCVNQLDVTELVAAAEKVMKTPTMPQERLEGQPSSSTALPARTLSVDEARALYDPMRCNLAVVLDDCARFTGGGMYTWQLARNLSRLSGVDVWLLSGTKDFVYAESIPPGERLHVVHDQHRSLFFHKDKRLHFPVVFGAPHRAGIDCVQYAKENVGVQCNVLIYETPNYIREYREGRDGENEYWLDYQKAMRDATNVITISKTVKRFLLEWMPELQGKAVIIHPSIASDVADKVLPVLDGNVSHEGRFTRAGRNDSIVMISRNVRYKGLWHALELIAERFAPGRFDTTTQLTINIIGDNAHALKANVRKEWSKRGVNVQVIEDIREDDKWRLLHEAKAVIHPSTFEGFGIPLAEAMYAGTPVLALPLGVFKECFCQYPFYFHDDEEMLTALHHIFAAWNEPDNDVGRSYKKLQLFLRDAWQYVMRRYSGGNLKLGHIGQACAVNLNSDKKGAISEARTHAVATLNDGETLRIAMVTPYGNKCGIAETTRSLLQHYRCTWKVFAPVEEHALVYPDSELVKRCWNRQLKTTTRLLNELLEYAPAIVHFEHEFSLFRNTREFFNLIQRLKEHGVKVVVTLHTVMDSEFLRTLFMIADKIIVTKECPNEAPGSVVIPLPIALHTQCDKNAARAELGLPVNAKIVGSFGMMQPHKGFRELLATYNDVAQQMHDEVVYMVSSYGDMTKNMHARTVCKDNYTLMNRGSIRMLLDYPPLDVVHKRLAAADVVVYFYQQQSQVSSSASVRDALAAGRPVIVSDTNMFREFTNEVNALKVPYKPFEQGVSQELAAAIVRVLNDTALSDSLSKAGYKMTLANQAKTIALRHMELYKSLLK